MKKHLISAVVLVLLMLSISVLAFADIIYPAPGDFPVGEAVDHLLATLDPGGTAATNPELLPEGLRLETEETEEGVNVYLRGVPTVPGTYDCVIIYNGSNSICTLHIVPAEAPELTPAAVSVETLPQQTHYTAGDTLNPEGLSLRVEMSDGSTQTVTEGYTLYPTRLENAGTQSIEVNFLGLLCSFSIEVAPAPEQIEGIGVLTLPSKVVYDVGEALEPAGLSIRVYTNNGTRDVSAEELSCSPMQLDTAGKQTVTVSYGDHSCTFEVQVLEEETPASLAVYHLPEQLDYTTGDVLETRGLVLMVTGSRHSTEFISEGYTCTPTHLNSAGRQEIQVKYKDLSCSFHVTVKEAAPIVTAEPFPAPSPAAPIVTAQPSPEAPSDPQPQPPARSGKALVAVIVIAAVLALAVLGVYVFVVNRSGEEFFAETVRELFRRKR